MRVKLVVLFTAIGAISFFFGLGSQQFSDARLGSADLSFSFGFEEPGITISCLDSTDCIKPKICINRQCVNSPVINFTMTNVGSDPITLNGAFVGIDRDTTTKQIEGYLFPLKEFLQVGESFTLLFELVDLEGNLLDIPEKKFQLVVDAEKIDDTTRGDNDPKVKEIKVKKSTKFKIT